MSVFSRLRTWWSKDEREVAEEATRMSPAEREVAEEDYQARRDDTRVESGRFLGGSGDYERDSEPPR